MTGELHKREVFMTLVTMNNRAFGCFKSSGGVPYGVFLGACSQTKFSDFRTDYP